MLYYAIYSKNRDIWSKLFRVTKVNVVQKARLARIQIAKATSGAAFVAKKRAAEARLAAQVKFCQFLPFDLQLLVVWSAAFEFDKIS